MFREEGRGGASARTRPTPTPTPMASASNTDRVTPASMTATITASQTSKKAGRRSGVLPARTITTSNITASSARQHERVGQTLSLKTAHKAVRSIIATLEQDKQKKRRVQVYAFVLMVCLSILIVKVMKNKSERQLNRLQRDQAAANESSSHFQYPSLFSPHRVVHPFDHADVLNRSIHTGDVHDLEHSLSIAFGIQASGESVGLLPRLISRIHSPINLYVIHIDAKTTPTVIQKFKHYINTNAHYKKNVYIMPPESLTYKGVSTVINSLMLMSFASNKNKQWKYYINLSASDYPLIHIDNLNKLLNRPLIKNGLLNYIMYFPKSEWVPYSFRIKNLIWDPAACNDFYADADAGAHSTNRMHKQKHHNRNRNKLFTVKAQRKNPIDDYRSFIFTKAETWSILSRSFIHYIIRSGFAKRMLLSHLHVLSVSEHFITDVIYNHPVWNRTVVPDSLRKIIWYFKGRRSGQHPYHLDHNGYAHFQIRKYKLFQQLTRNNKDINWFVFWDEIIQSNAIFARKFSVKDSPLMDRIDLEISGAGINFDHPQYDEFKQSRRDYYSRLVEYFDQITQKTLTEQNVHWSSKAYPKEL